MVSRRMLAKVLVVSFVLAGLLGQSMLKAQGTTGKIEAGKPTYAAKPREAWKDKGRIVGTARTQVPFTVTVLDASGKQVKAAEAQAGKDGVRVYEVGWLDPGVYTLRVTAEGYTPLQLEKLEVRANQDLRVNLEFTK
jgi:hypothetical protein